VNKIEKLIQEMCPEGVPHLALEEVAEIVKGRQVNKETMSDWYAYPVYNGGIFPSGRHTQFNCPPETITVSQGGASAGFVNFVREPLWLGAHCYAVSPKQRVINRWLFFVLKNSQTRLQDKKVGAGIPALDRKTLAQLKIPVPPLEVQEEIVSILDKFTELEAELEAERKARSEIYRWVSDSIFRSTRTNLLPFQEMDSFKFIRLEAPFVKLEQLGTFHRGRGIQKSDLRESGIPAIHYGQVYTQYSVWTDVTKSFVSEDVAIKSSKGLPGDVLITISDVTPNNVGRAVTWLGDTPIAVGGDLLIFRHSLHPNYVSHFFSSSLFSEQKLSRVTGATVRHLSASDLKSIQIPVPPMESQVKIAEVLDKAHRLIDTREGGISNEIQARRKQYEYYRNKLLTFKELDAA
jgi:type I restriction enzyme S subunit